MPEFITTNGHTQVVVPLTTLPFSHQEQPTITGRLFSEELGTVLYGNYNMEYLLPRGDKVRLIANHDEKTLQFIVMTHDPELIKQLPGARNSSLVANIINILRQYQIRSASYVRPLSAAQEEKLYLTQQSIESLKELLNAERELNIGDYAGQERVRRRVIELIEECRDANRILANNPLVSEGSLGDFLFDARKIAQDYQFNRIHPVSRHDQMDFTQIDPSECLIWDSELHVGHQSDDLDNVLRVLCEYYQLAPTERLTIPANRFVKLASFFQKVWRHGHDWVNYLAIKEKPTHKTQVEQLQNNLTVTRITPYYRLQGLKQTGYSDLNDLMSYLTENTSVLGAETIEEAQHLLEDQGQDHGTWVVVANEQVILLQDEDQILSLRYFEEDGLFYPLPNGDDLFTLGKLSERHLYMLERTVIQLKAFATSIPIYFYDFFRRIGNYIRYSLYEDFFKHVHASHAEHSSASEEENTQNDEQTKIRNSLIKILQHQGLLGEEQSLEEFIEEHINNSHYVIAHAEHLPSPPTYDNPFHRILALFRHINSFFIDASERDPIVGTLAMAAYAYGAGAILNPEALKVLLSKLHLNGLIAGIQPTQNLAHWMSHGTMSQALSAGAVYWQGAITAGDLDTFMMDAIASLKGDLAGIAIVSALAISLGYGIGKALPVLVNDIGDFPYTTYATIGGRGGAAIYDTIMHPGDDWILGTSKWFLNAVVAVAKMLVAPFFEGYHYGFSAGFLNGWKKSGVVLLRVSKKNCAALIDLALAILTIPFQEVSSLLIHVPFRGITGLLSKTLAMLGYLRLTGELLLVFANRRATPNYVARFKLSPLYGFTSPFGHFSDTLLINIGINFIRFLFLAPLQLLKNILILPIIDFISLSVRVGIMLVDPLSRVLAYASGKILCTLGTTWDNTVGILFVHSANGVTRLSNWIDNQAGRLKQKLLSCIQIARLHVYHWAFAEEDPAFHSSSNTQSYCLSNPEREGLLPRSESHCLLHALLHSNIDASLSLDALPQVAHHQALFASNDSEVVQTAKEDNVYNEKP